MLATQNPIEQEGTYPLPEAQLDRFMLELRVSYPSQARGRGDRRADHRQPRAAALQPVLDADRCSRCRRWCGGFRCRRGLIRAAVSLARMTRPADADAPAFIKEYVEWGAGPRASQYLVLGAKARAAMAGRPMADLDDVRAVAPSVLRHRLVTNFAAEAADRTSEDLVRELVSGKGWLGLLSGPTRKRRAPPAWPAGRALFKTSSKRDSARARRKTPAHRRTYGTRPRARPAHRL